jgi:lambda repressor-like predicted transcriptional regulator
VGKERGMTPNEIRAAMALRGIKQVDIARAAGVSPGFVNQVINGVGRNKGFRVRPYIAKAIGKTVEEIWPDVKNQKKDITTLCL